MNVLHQMEEKERNRLASRPDQSKLQTDQFMPKLLWLEESAGEIGRLFDMNAGPDQNKERKRILDAIYSADDHTARIFDEISVSKSGIVLAGQGRDFVKSLLENGITASIHPKLIRALQNQPKLTAEDQLKFEMTGSSMRLDRHATVLTLRDDRQIGQTFLDDPKNSRNVIVFAVPRESDMTESDLKIFTGRMKRGLLHVGIHDTGLSHFLDAYTGVFTLVSDIARKQEIISPDGDPTGHVWNIQSLEPHYMAMVKAAGQTLSTANAAITWHLQQTRNTEMTG